MKSKYTIRMIRAQSGQLTGVIFRDSEEICRASGCSNAAEAKATLAETLAVDADFVVDGFTEQPFTTTELFELIPYRDEVSELISHVSIQPIMNNGLQRPAPGFAAETSIKDLLKLSHSIWGRRGWYLYDDDLGGFTFECNPTDTDLLEHLLDDVLLRSFDPGMYFPDGVFKLPKLPGELIEQDSIQNKKALLERAMYVPAKFEVEFLWELQTAVHKAVDDGLMCFCKWKRRNFLDQRGLL